MGDRKIQQAKDVVVPRERIESKILFIRGKKVILDAHLAELYGVTTGNLNKAVKRNIDRFPDDFMFQLRKEEYEALRFQFGILKRGAHAKYLPYVFTEQGVAMLSSVLNSKWAIMVNIQMMRTFTKLRELMITHHLTLYFYATYLSNNCTYFSLYKYITYLFEYFKVIVK